MFLAIQMIYVAFAAVMVFFPRKIWEIFYGNFSKDAEPKNAMLMAYRAAGIVALAVFFIRGLWGS